MNILLSPSPLWQHAGLGATRIVVGLLLVYHGLEVFDREVMNGYTTWDSISRTPAPRFMVYLGKTSELLTGILLTAGLFTRLASIVIVATFIYITFFVGHGKFWYGDQHPFMFVVIGFIFFLTGPGKWSVDASLSRSRQEAH